jgi:hypothetical protein
MIKSTGRMFVEERESLEKESVTEIKWCRILKNLPGYYEVGTKH